MALRDFFRGDRRGREEHTRYPLDPLSRDSWRDEAEARYGSDMYRDYDDERRHFNNRWQNSYSGPGQGRIEERDRERHRGSHEYGGSSNNPFYGEHPLARAGSTYDSGYFGSKYGLPTTPWRGDADNAQFDDLVYGGRSSDPNAPSQSRGRGEHSGRGPRGYRRSDDRIKEDVCQRLTDDRHIDASNIEVAVSDREVTLTGTVTSRMQKRHAEDILERLPGVRDVINNIRVVSETDSIQSSQSYGSQSAGTQSTRLGGQIR